jgi:hypothetical protein
MALNANRYKSIPREIAITGRGFLLKKATLSARPKAVPAWIYNSGQAPQAVCRTLKVREKKERCRDKRWN